MTPNELYMISIGVEKLYYELQDRIMSDVVRRVLKTGEITSTADYQLNRYSILGNSTEFIESEIRRMTGLTDAEVWKLYDDVIDKEYTRNQALYEQINRDFQQLQDNRQLRAVANAIIAQTTGALNNISNSLGFSVDYGGRKTVFTPLSEYYQKYIDAACMDIVSGAFDYNTVLRRVVKQMTSSGLQCVDYASGYRSRAPVAARRAVMTGVHQLSNKINEQVAKELDTDDYEVTAHYGARLEHSFWQGGVYSYKELQEICGLGSVTGLCGANCRHSYYPFVKGVSTRSYTSEELAAMRERDAQKRSYMGKEYNAYEASQKQRHYETTMRAQRARVKQLQAGKADSDTILAARTRYLQTLHEYQGFSKAMKIPTQMERVYMDGLGRVAPGKAAYQKTIAKMDRNAILKSELRDTGLRGVIHTTPVKIDMDLLSFDDEHINKQREHGVTFEEAKSYIRNAVVSETVWKGRFERYYSLNGVAYVNKNNLQIRTAFKPEQYNKTVQRVMEVLRKYG